MRTRLATVLTLVAAGSILGAWPAAAAPEKGLPDRARAKAVLARAQALARGQGVRTGYELTPALAELRRSLPRLSGRDRRAAEALLARPDQDDGASDLDAINYTTAEKAAMKVECNTDFCVHWTEAPGSAHAPDTTDDGPPSGTPNGVPDYVDTMLAVFQDDVYPCENGTAAAACAGNPGLGWREAPADGRPSLGADTDKLDVYLMDVGAQQIFGYNAPDLGQPADQRSLHSYMVMDNDYAEFGFADPLDALRVTAAHEYNHALQNGYDAWQDTWMFEATAVWTEEKVYPAIDDWLRYLPPWRDLGAVPLTAFDRNAGTDIKAYGSALWNHWIEGRYGAAAVRAAWENSANPPAGFLPDFAPDAYSSALGRQNAFSEEFVRFAGGVAEWQAPAGGFQATGDTGSFGEMPRAATLALDQPVQGSLDNTTFALLDVPVPPAGSPDLIFTGTLPDGTRGGIAIVGRRGGPADGTLAVEALDLPTGGRGTIVIRDAGSFSRITAVVANADVTIAGFDQSTFQWVFARDGQTFSGKVATLLAPTVAITMNGQVGVTTATLTGTVAPNGDDTAWHFEYGRAGAFDLRTPDQTVGADGGTQAVTASLTGLSPSTPYDYRLVGTNRGGTSVSQVVQFGTLTPPDTAAPVVRATIARRIRRARLARRGLPVRVRTNEPAKLALKLVLDRATARRLKLRNRTIARRSAGLGALDRTLRLRLTRKARLALRRLRRPGRMTVTIVATDAKGNRAAPVKRTLRLLR